MDGQNLFHKTNTLIKTENTNCSALRHAVPCNVFMRRG